MSEKEIEHPLYVCHEWFGETLIEPRDATLFTAQHVQQLNELIVMARKLDAYVFCNVPASPTITKGLLEFREYCEERLHIYNDSKGENHDTN